MLVSAYVRMLKWDPNNTWSGGTFNSVVYVHYDTLCTIGESVSHINISCQSYFVAAATDTSEYKPIVFVGSSGILFFICFLRSLEMSPIIMSTALIWGGTCIDQYL